MSSGSVLLPFFFESLFVSLVLFGLSLSLGAPKVPTGASKRAERTRLVEDRTKEKRLMMTPLPRHVSSGASANRKQNSPALSIEPKWRLKAVTETQRTSL